MTSGQSVCRSQVTKIVYQPSERAVPHRQGFDVDDGQNKSRSGQQIASIAKPDLRVDAGDCPWRFRFGEQTPQRGERSGCEHHAQEQSPGSHHPCDFREGVRQVRGAVQRTCRQNKIEAVRVKGQPVFGPKGPAFIPFLRAPERERRSSRRLSLSQEGIGPARCRPNQQGLFKAATNQAQPLGQLNRHVLRKKVSFAPGSTFQQSPTPLRVKQRRP